jgi:hypothetical protein
MTIAMRATSSTNLDAAADSEMVSGSTEQPQDGGGMTQHDSLLLPAHNDAAARRQSARLQQRLQPRR